MENNLQSKYKIHNLKQSFIQNLLPLLIYFGKIVIFYVLKTEEEKNRLLKKKCISMKYNYELNK